MNRTMLSISYNRTTITTNTHTLTSFMHACRSTLPRNISRNIKRVSLKPLTSQSRNMAFFPRNFYNSESSFTPLFRLLDDFDNYKSQGSGQHQGRRPGMPTWQPKFDIRETGDNYELHGELAGMNKENVHIEFTDPQTMLIRGRTERNYSAGTQPAGHVEDALAHGAISKGSEESKSSHRATVEDEDEGTASNQKLPSDNNDTVTQHKKPADHAKYWLTERSIGEFSRSFNFPTRIDQDAVTANFKDGILSITVPKAKRHESRRIAIN